MCILFAVSNVVFSKIVMPVAPNGTALIVICFVILGIGILNAILPMQKINEYLFKITDDEELSLTYEEAEKFFDNVCLFFYFIFYESYIKI